LESIFISTCELLGNNWILDLSPIRGLLGMTARRRIGGRGPCGKERVYAKGVSVIRVTRSVKGNLAISVTKAGEGPETIRAIVLGPIRAAPRKAEHYDCEKNAIRLHDDFRVSITAWTFGASYVMQDEIHWTFGPQM
jgi:hypothetical protein